MGHENLLASWGESKPNITFWPITSKRCVKKLVHKARAESLPTGGRARPQFIWYYIILQYNIWGWWYPIVMIVYNGKSYLNGWFGGTPIYGNPHVVLIITSIIGNRRDRQVLKSPFSPFCPFSPVFLCFPSWNSWTLSLPLAAPTPHPPWLPALPILPIGEKKYGKVAWHFCRG